MSQFTLTPDEDSLVISALRVNAGQYAAMFGSSDPALEALIAKTESQLAAPAVVVETLVVDAPVVVETPVVEETPAA
jgi:hypothetical protein